MICGASISMFTMIRMFTRHVTSFAKREAAFQVFESRRYRIARARAEEEKIKTDDAT